MVSCGLTLGGKYSLLARNPTTLCSCLSCLCSCLPACGYPGFLLLFPVPQVLYYITTISSFFPSPRPSPSRAVCSISTAQPPQPEHEVVPEAAGNGTDCGSVYSQRWMNLAPYLWNLSWTSLQILSVFEGLWLGHVWVNFQGNSKRAQAFGIANVVPAGSNILSQSRGAPGLFKK